VHERIPSKTKDSTSVHATEFALFAQISPEFLFGWFPKCRPSAPAGDAHKNIDNRSTIGVINAAATPDWD
jgi:hypothetical protein